MFSIKRQSTHLLSHSLLVAGLMLCGILLSACGRGNFSGLEALPVDDYVEKPGNFLGNTYLLSVQIDSQIEWKEGVGRILAVEAEGSSSRIPIFVRIPSNKTCTSASAMRCGPISGREG